MKYSPTIGLEIHAELKTKSKMFCDSKNNPNETQPNQNVCPVCLAHPGTLPTINKKAVESVIRVGLALGGKINPVTKFDRKNYFYPDLPKGYQISQYDMPLVKGGELMGVRIRRIHLEEDTGKLLHSDDGHSLVDFNRAGVPLMELVTEPDITSAEQASAFARELQLILRYLGVSDADMESGQMRIEANVSVSKDGGEMGTKVELKNINSFRAMEDAVRYELKRQEEVLESGGVIFQETRGWDEAKQKSVIQRTKEDAHDYRYFPEPDLPPFETSFFDLEKLKDLLPELPEEKRKRFEKEFGLTEKQTRTLVEDKKLADFFEAAVSELATRDERTISAIEKKSQNLLFNYLTSDFMGLLNNQTVYSWSDVKVNPERLAHLVDLIADGKIMSRQAKEILKKMFDTGEDPEDILIEGNLHTVSDEVELGAVVGEVVRENPQAVADYKKGKVASLQFLIGKSMAKLKGKGNPDKLKDIILKLLTK